MFEMKITESSVLRLLGRMDREQEHPAFDWTGSGLEVNFRGTDLWAELEAPDASPVMWMIVLADGCPVGRFPVEQGRRFYPLVLGMEADKCRVVSLLKETQAMPSNPEATVFALSLKGEGTLEELPPYGMKIEFIGDSLTSGEGALAPKGNEEWITQWFSCRGNYSWYACRELNAERRVLSQSGYGVCWDWQHDETNNMTDGYEKIAGVMHGEAAAARGLDKTNDFAAWQPDIVCIRLLSNDNNGMRARESFAEDRDTVTEGCKKLIRKVRRNNPATRIVWILPGSDGHPEIGRDAVEACLAEGITGLNCFALPDYGPDDLGARYHPNAEWNRKAGLLLADYLKTI